MAQLALGIAGGIVGSFIAPGAGTILGFQAGAFVGFGVGAVAGSIIDQQYVFPAIFGTGAGSVQGQRLEDFNVQTASEGSPMVKSYGPSNRVPGVIIWMGPIIEVQDTTSGGGKGGGGVGGDGGGTAFRYFVHLGIAVGEGPITAIHKIWADGKLVYDDSAGGPTATNNWKDQTFYLGTTTQTPDPLIQSVQGAGNTPAFRNTAYVVFEHFNMTKFGNRLPQFSFLTDAGVATLQGTIDDLINRSGKTTVSQVSPFASLDTNSIIINGYNISGPVTPIASIEPLMMAYNLAAYEDAGVLNFYVRGTLPIIPIDPNDLGSQEKDAATAAMTIEDVPDYSLPTEVDVQYLDVALDYQQGSQVWNLATSPVIVKSSVNLPVAMTADSARSLAKSLLYQTWAQRLTYTFALPIKYIGLAEGDSISVPYMGTDHFLRITQLDKGANGLIQVTASSEFINTFTEIAVADELQLADEGTVAGTGVTWYILDIPAFNTQQEDLTGYYYVMCESNFAGLWSGGTIFQQKSVLLSGQLPGYNGPPTTNEFVAQNTIANESTMGEAGAALPDVNNGSNIPGWLCWDRVNAVTVVLINGSLTSHTATDVLNGLNWAVLGSEIIAFQNATLTATNTYVLSTLLRGLRNTEALTGTHDINEKFILLDGTVAFSAEANAIIGSTATFKGVPDGVDIATISEVNYSFKGATRVPFAVCNVTITRDTSNNVIFSWQRRTRLVWKMFGTEQFPIEPSEEQAEVDVIISGAVIRTLSTSTNSVLYSAAQQTLDGLTAGVSPVTVQIFQLSPIVGRGNEVQITG